MMTNLFIDVLEFCEVVMLLLFLHKIEHRYLEKNKGSEMGKLLLLCSYYSYSVLLLIFHLTRMSYLLIS
jgi:hypothetical protein